MSNAAQETEEPGGCWTAEPVTRGPPALPAHQPPGDPPVLVVRAGLGGAVFRAVVHVEGAVALAALAGDRQQHGAAVLQAVVKAGLEEDAAGAVVLVLAGAVGRGTAETRARGSWNLCPQASPLDTRFPAPGVGLL